MFCSENQCFDSITVYVANVLQLTTYFVVNNDDYDCSLFITKRIRDFFLFLGYSHPEFKFRIIVVKLDSIYS